MTKKHFGIIIGIIGLLLICNIATLSILLSNNHHSHKHERRGKCFLKSELNLSAEQCVAFDSIKKKHKHKAKELDRKLKSYQHNMILLVSTDNIDTNAVKETQQMIIGMQDSLLQTTICQYKEYRNVLDSARQEKLKNIYLEIFLCNKKECKRQK
ncbi:MAG: hypothetical protein IKD33_01640 [Bacteroidales bacterium]|nr:hypothetical protein [Bacteroidales bacterium]